MPASLPSLVSGSDLQEELEKILSGYYGGKCRIVALRRRRSNYSSSCTIENLEVTLGSGKSLKLILKDLSPSSLLGEARNVRPEFLYSPQREIETYRTILDPRKFGTAVCYGTLEESQSQRYWLFLERVEGILLWQAGRLAKWETAARWLAGFHSRFAAEARQSTAFSSIPLRYDTAHYHLWIRRAERFVALRPQFGTIALKRQFAKLAKSYDRVVEVLLTIPVTLIHGEFYPSNILLRKNEDTNTICPIDWEVTAIGPGLFDLAALASGAWSLEQKQRLVRAYQESLTKSDNWPPSFAELMRLVSFCQLHLAVQWLGWASDWAPPKGHQHDWLQEAVNLAQHLKLIR